MTPTALAYMTHPVAPYTVDAPQGTSALRRYWGPDAKITISTAINLFIAKRWLRALQDANPHVVIIAPWITVCEIYDDANPEERATGLLRDCYVVARCDILVLVGGRIGNGMQIEAEAAESAGIPIFDMTDLGREPLDSLLPQMLIAV